LSSEFTDPILPRTHYVGLLTESRRWQHYRPRAGDVVVSTPPKSGTTWTQGILFLLMSGDPSVKAEPSRNAPWFDNKLNDLDDVLAGFEAQTTRRHVKTHTPLDGIPIWEELRYITVYRHPIDVHFSARKHVANYRPDYAEDMGVDRSLYPDDPRESFRIFCELAWEEHGALRSVVNHYLQCLQMEPRENLLRLHYADMTRDLAGKMARVADHIGVAHPPEVMQDLVKAATFGNMKANADRFALAAGQEFWRSDAGFFDSATSNKWEGVLTRDDLAFYDQVISGLLDPDARRWLEWGAAPPAGGSA